MSILNIYGLTHGFGEKTLFKDTSFRLLKGEHIGLIGANGTGKTTFFNLLTGRLLPDTGTIERASGMKTGYLDQHSSLKPGKSIRDTLKEAFQNLLDTEEKATTIGMKLTNASGEEIERLLKKLGELQDYLEQSEYYSMDSRVENVANGLGLSSLRLDTPVDRLSGGQRTKVLLGKLLLEKPDILLLDEPTNYLDREHIEWLADYLTGYRNSFILVSHDTHFLNRVTNVTYNVENMVLKRYPGNYDKFLQLSGQSRNEYILQYQHQQEEIARMEEFVQKNIARASTTRRAQSRQKALEKLTKLEKPQTVARPAFSFKMARESGHLIFESVELEVGYDKPLFSRLDLKVHRNEKIAITGCNGIGKTTLLKTISGVIPCLDGLVDYGDYLHPAYYEQEGSINRNLTALEEVWCTFPSMSQKEVRSALARCGLKQEHVLQSMSSLSGGEQSKVHLCKLMLTPSNWLLLDEPTNHLDVTAKAVLKESLSTYMGTILLVCHEEEFYKDWVTDVWNMEIFRK